MQFPVVKILNFCRDSGGSSHCDGRWL